jgi:hypothetical protein
MCTQYILFKIVKKIVAQKQEHHPIAKNTPFQK